MSKRASEGKGEELAAISAKAETCENSPTGKHANGWPIRPGVTRCGYCDAEATKRAHGRYGSRSRTCGVGISETASSA